MLTRTRSGTTVAILVVLAALCAPPLFGQEVPIAAKACDPSDATTLGMRVCQSERLLGLEMELDSLEHQQREVQGTRERVLSDRASRAWRLYQDLQCEAQTAQFGQSTMGPLEQISCLAALTERRVEYIRSQLEP